MMVSNDRESDVVRAWWDLVGKWLNNKNPKSHLTDATVQLLKQMDQAKERDNRKKAWDLIERLKYLSDQLKDGDEIAEVRVKCARIAVEAGALNEAVKLLQEAVEKYHSNQHNFAITTWLLGCIYWILPGKQNEAIFNWQRSLKKFDDLANRYEASREDEQWYSKRCEGMRKALIRAIEDEGLPNPTAFSRFFDQDTENKSSTGAQDQASSPSARETQNPGTSSTRMDILQLFSVVEEIPAGGFGPTGFRSNSIGEVEIDHFMICGNPHRMVRLKNSGWVVNLSAYEHFVVKVTGDSMNKEGVDIGDYVLLRHQPQPDNQDIVAVEIIDLDPCATLKRFISRGEDIILRPNSTNPIHIEKVFKLKEYDNRFFIRGVALAVFKPV